MAPLRTAFSASVTGEAVAPRAEPRECEKQLVAPQTRLGLFWENERDIFVFGDDVCIHERRQPVPFSSNDDRRSQRDAGGDLAAVKGRRGSWPAGDILNNRPDLMVG